MYDELDESFGADDDDFCGVSIQESAIKIVELSIPDCLYHLEHLLDHYVTIAVNSSSRLPSALQRDQLVRQLCNIMWAMRPKPEFYTVFTEDGSRYVAVDYNSAHTAMTLLNAALQKDNCLRRLITAEPFNVLPDNPYKYVKKDKLFVWKDGKLVKTYFTYKTMNNNMKNGPEGIRLFRERLVSYASVVCVDVEVHEWAQTELLEVGISEYFPLEDRISSAHFIVKENEWRRNGSLVSDHRDFFMFGKSEVVEQERLMTHLRSIFSEDSSVCLVAHNAASDIKYLGQIDPYFLRIPDLFDVYDTQYLHQELRSRTQPTNLESVLIDLFGRTPECLHNAGNDAHYTLCALLHMAGLDVNF